MDIRLLTVGKTSVKFVKEGIEEYSGRLRHYIGFGIDCVADIRNTRKMTEQQQKEAEGKMLLGELTASDFVVLLDEHGAEYTSPQFASWLEKRMASGYKRIVFIVGGPYGFSPAVYERANTRLSLSQMTFPHELVRLFFTEQLYRAFTILRGEPYHHV